MAEAYVIVDMQISDLEQYKQYMVDAPATVKAWYDGENYRLVRTKRQGATVYFNMVLVEGVTAPV